MLPAAVLPDRATGLPHPCDAPPQRTKAAGITGHPLHGIRVGLLPNLNVPRLVDRLRRTMA